MSSWIVTVRGALPRAEREGLDRVARLARLRDPDDEVVLVDHRVPVDPLARDVELDRDARPLLDHVPADDAGVVGGVPQARRNDAAIVLEPPPSVMSEASSTSLPSPHAVSDLHPDRLRLLVDLPEPNVS